MWYKIEKNCRSCGSTNIEQIFSFGETPLADRLLTSNQLNEPEYRAPLDLMFCHECALVQISETVDPEVLFFEEYPYFSSVSKSLLQHFRESTFELITARKLNSNSLVIEAASNDGYMLRNFKKKDIPVLGIDPAKEPAKVAQQSGIETHCTFFTKEFADILYKEGKIADVFLANNVLAHVPDLNGFVEGINTILKQTGVAVIEVPYVVDLVEKCEFDTIYHQHLCYFSVTALSNLFRRHRLFLNDVKRVPIHGGTLRLFVGHEESTSNRMRELLNNEIKNSVNKINYFNDFTERIKEIKTLLMELLYDLKGEGKRIAAYGAAAKANTLLSYCEIDKNLIDYVVDLNRFKQGRYMGGNHLQIFSPEKLHEDTPDYLLILAWNFVDEIIKQQNDFRNKGGKFVVPIPSPKII